MENKIEFILKKFEKSLCFQITEQNGFNFSGGVLRDDGVPRNIFSRKLNIDGYTIYISRSSRPDIKFTESRKNSYIYLRGEQVNRDLDIVKIPFDSNDQRDKVYELIIKSFGILVDQSLIVNNFSVVL